MAVLSLCNVYVYLRFLFYNRWNDLEDPFFTRKLLIFMRSHLNSSKIWSAIVVVELSLILQIQLTLTTYFILSTNFIFYTRNMESILLVYMFFHSSYRNYYTVGNYLYLKVYKYILNIFNILITRNGDRMTTIRTHANIFTQRKQILNETLF